MKDSILCDEMENNCTEEFKNVPFFIYDELYKNP
jgi:hypothetical protein